MNQSDSEIARDAAAKYNDEFIAARKCADAAAAALAEIETAAAAARHALDSAHDWMSAAAAASSFAKKQKFADAGDFAKACKKFRKKFHSNAWRTRMKMGQIKPGDFADAFTAAHEFDSDSDSK